MSKEGNFLKEKTAFLSLLATEESKKILLKFIRRMKWKVGDKEFKKELWVIVMEFGELILMGYG